MQHICEDAKAVAVHPYVHKISDSINLPQKAFSAVQGANVAEQRSENMCRMKVVECVAVFPHSRRKEVGLRTVGVGAVSQLVGAGAGVVH